MTRTYSNLIPVLATFLGLSALGCESGGVGDPCTPEDEYIQDFNGFAITEVNIESKSFQCETRVCIVNHFQGRVSCPYGQTAEDIDTKSATDGARCRVPGTDGSNTVPQSSNPDDPNVTNIDVIRVPVAPQVVARSAENAVYCSCRCAGPDPAARYCECPSGFECAELVKEIGLGKEQLAGSYCVKAGTVFDPKNAPLPKECGEEGVAACTETGQNPPLDVPQ